MISTLDEHPFCNPDRVKNWDILTPEQAEIDVKWAIDLAEERVQQIIDLPEAERTFENTFGKLWWSDNELGLALSRIGLLRALKDKEAFTTVLADKIAPAVSAMRLKLVTNEKLFNVLESVAGSQENSTHARHIADTIKQFKERGLSLNEEQREKYKELCEELSRDTIAYTRNLTKYNDDWKYKTKDEESLDGIPESCLSLARKKAKEENLGDDYYLFDLHDDNAYYVTSFAHNQSMRSRFMHGCSNAGLDNEELVKRIVLNRAKVADLFGYKTYADMAVEHNMLSTTKDIHHLLEHVFDSVRDGLWKFMKEIRAKAGDENKPLAPGDVPYYQEKIRKERYEYDIDATRKFFPLNSVLDGLFTILWDKMRVRFQRRHTVDPNLLTEEEHLWHPSVQVYEVYRKGKYIGDMYFDLYNRKGKQEGAWSSCLQSRYAAGSPLAKVRKPCYAQQLVAANFRNNAEYDLLSGLDHTEIEILFHEVGHALHHMLSEPTYPTQEASGVERDFIEVPSTLMEHLTWEKDVLMLLNARSKFKLSDDLADKIVSCKDRLRDYTDYRQCLYNKIDQKFNGMTLEEAEEFAKSDAKLGTYVKDLLEEELKGIPEFNNLCMMPYHFQHIFAAGYAAKYYSYLHSEEIARSVYNIISSDGDAMWEKWCTCVLEKGATIPADKLISDFLGIN